MNTENTPCAFTEMGFRPFFLGAAVFAILSMVIWSGVYLFQFNIPLQSITQFEWHAHEMIFGYAFAVISGFLLTSVRTWTKRPTAHGKSLVLLFGLWLSARTLYLFGTSYIEFAAIFDILFTLTLTSLLAYRIIQAKKWGQLAIVAILLLLTSCHIIFYLGVFDIVEHGIHRGLYGALFMVIALILVMGRRVIPFFIEKGVKGSVNLFNSKWLDIPIMALYFSFAISELFFNAPLLTAALALTLFALNTIRLVGWHHRGIWKRSMLWSLYLSFWLISIGFLLFAGSYYMDIPKLIAIHALTVGGIGIITLSMMIRVSLAHTGRDVYQPPKGVIYALSAILLSALIRIALPLIDPSHYELWVGLSQACWIVAFLIFTISYVPILTKPKLNQ